MTATNWGPLPPEIRDLWLHSANNKITDVWDDAFMKLCLSDNSKGETMHIEKGDLVKVLDRNGYQTRVLAIATFGAEIRAKIRTPHNGISWELFENLSRVNEKYKPITNPCSEPLKNTKQRRWEFHVPHRSYINWEVVGKDCTEDTPVVLVSWAGSSYAMVHNSIIKKAGLKGQPGVPTKYEGLATTSSMTLFPFINQVDVIKWAKRVKTAPWPNKPADTTVVVKVPKL